MDFYFPDSQDQIDPSFDFVTEQRSELRIRQRDDRYPHEWLDEPPYQGMLVSKAMVDGVDGGAGRYSAQQRQRLYRVGIREFFRLTGEHARIRTLGDCGAFSYVRQEEPPYTVDDVIDFYDAAGVDAGISLDHVILGFSLQDTLDDDTLRSEWKRRQALTLERAEEFLRRRDARGCRFEPVGVAQDRHHQPARRADRDADVVEAVVHDVVAVDRGIDLGKVPERLDRRLDEKRHETEAHAVFLLEALAVARAQIHHRLHVHFVERGEDGRILLRLQQTLRDALAYARHGYALFGTVTDGYGHRRN